MSHRLDARLHPSGLWTDRCDCGGCDRLLGFQEIRNMVGGIKASSVAWWCGGVATRRGGEAGRECGGSNIGGGTA